MECSRARLAYHYNSITLHFHLSLLYMEWPEKSNSNRWCRNGSISMSFDRRSAWPNYRDLPELHQYWLYSIHRCTKDTTSRRAKFHTIPIYKRKTNASFKHWELNHHWPTIHGHLREEHINNSIRLKPIYIEPTTTFIATHLSPKGSNFSLFRNYRQQQLLFSLLIHGCLPLGLVCAACPSVCTGKGAYW